MMCFDANLLIRQTHKKLCMVGRFLKFFYEKTPKFLSETILTVFENVMYNRDYKQEYNIRLKKFTFIFKNGIKIFSYYNLYREYSRGLNCYLSHYTLKPGDIVIDAGAYVGSFTLYASKIVGEQGKIISFEPDPINYQKLLRNIELNGEKNIIAINKGLYSRNDLLKFYLGEHNTTLIASKNLSKKQITELPVVQLDDVLKSLNIHKVDFIKMDIEGAEIEALKGANKILESRDLELAIASYHFVDNEQTYKIIERDLISRGYFCETKCPQHLTTFAYRIK
jgi:FkbM family methyltransferase